MFDICIPSYNREKFVSLLTNSIPDDISVNVSDNGGFYVHSDILKKRNNVHVFHSEEVLPIFTNWNMAVSFSKSPLFFLPSDDDLYYGNMLQVVNDELETIQANQLSDISMVVFGHDLIDENGKVLSSWRPPCEGLVDSDKAFEIFRFGVDARMPSVLINRKKYDDIGGINISLQLTAADSELIQKLALAGKVVFSKEIISGYRVWPGSLTHKKIASIEWVEEIDKWTRNISSLLYKKNYTKAYIKKTTDEIKLRNIVAGVFYADGVKGMVQFLCMNKYPYHATLKTQLRLLYRIILKVINK